MHEDDPTDLGMAGAVKAPTEAAPIKERTSVVAIFMFESKVEGVVELQPTICLTIFWQFQVALVDCFFVVDWTSDDAMGAPRIVRELQRERNLENEKFFNEELKFRQFDDVDDYT